MSRCRTRWIIGLASVMLAGGCGGETGADEGPCEPNPCDSPPSARCEGVVAYTFPTVGNCAVVGEAPECAYDATMTDCATAGQVCSDGECVDDPCEPNPCDDPPADNCDGNAVVTYEALGSCEAVAGTASCNYVETSRHDCTDDDLVCDQGGCVSAVDPCAPNPCDDPPADDCTGDVANVYPAVGECLDVGGTADCTYEPVSEDCSTTGRGCQGGVCVLPGCTDNADCDDGVTCTLDLCNGAVCSNTTIDASCTDGLSCNGVETCDSVTDCQAGTPVTCDDGVGCTQDVCVEPAGTCASTTVDASCDDGQACNGLETCDAGSDCQAGSPMDCDDGFSCTLDECHEPSGACTNTAIAGTCDDGLFCSGVEVCDTASPQADQISGCVPGTSPNCGDGVACTVDTCDETNDVCTNAPDSGLCNDTIACTDDVCDPVNGCVVVNNDNNCQNGQFCDGTEHCDPSNPGADATSGCMSGSAVICSESDGVPCTVPQCDEGTDACVEVPNDTVCTDSEFCNGAEVCDPANGCEPGTPPCNDGVSCTIDCDEVNDACVAVPNNTLCDDGLWCNGAETCAPTAPGADPTSGCFTGTSPLVCNDGIACTADTCSESTHTCVSLPDHALCNPGEFCVSPVGCTPATACSTDPQCDDGDDCNGVETCDTIGGYCVLGAPVDCDDGVACTVDSCNPSDGTCSNVPNDGACDDGLVCNGMEICHASSGCLVGTPIDCNDGFSCTLDSCLEPTGVCEHLPQGSECNDTVFCNGVELCDPLDGSADPNSGCVTGTPISCNDGVACTDDSCDATLDACRHVPANSNCACGESCDPANGCGNWCTVSFCGGKLYACGDCADNDGDCDIDDNDAHCLSPCDDNEDGFYTDLPGGGGQACNTDCYFDGDDDPGDDDCYWSHECDPLGVAPNYDPAGQQCEYDPNATITGTAMTCAQAGTTQSQQCTDFCGTITPNGCDCFGCCDIPGAPTSVWLGSENNGQPSCTVSTLLDPTMCRPCTIVAACFNPCETCELCVGKPTLPAGCQCQECPAGAQLCGAPCGAPCPAGEYCNSGCCTTLPF